MAKEKNIYLNYDLIHSFPLPFIMVLPRVVKRKHILEVESTEYSPGSITQQFCDLEQLFHPSWELCIYYFLNYKFILKCFVVRIKIINVYTNRHFCHPF